MKPKHIRFSPKKLERVVKTEKGWTWGMLAFELSKASGKPVSESRIYAWRNGVEPTGQIVQILAEVTGKSTDYFYEEVKVVKGAKA